jgi:hypothetical protein
MNAQAEEVETPKMQQVELVRSYVARKMEFSLNATRSFISSLPGNAPIVEMLRGKSGEHIHAVMVEALMAELGQPSSLDVNDGHSKTRRAVATPRRRVD